MACGCKRRTVNQINRGIFEGFCVFLSLLKVPKICFNIYIKITSPSVIKWHQAGLLLLPLGAFFANTLSDIFLFLLMQLWMAQFCNGLPDITIATVAADDLLTQNIKITLKLFGYVSR